MTAALGPYIMRHPEVKNNMEHFMLQFVSPELSSPEPYLRAIVSWSVPFLVSFFCLFVLFLKFVADASCINRPSRSSEQ
jgi:hypothetical protein